MTCLTHDRLRPARALVHPLFLGALFLLAINDHWLKGSGLLPGVVTGKLSDFAGLLVAPVLFAFALRVRTMRGFVLAHLPVGLIFAAIQLSAPAADLWSGAMGAIGFPWVITRDATDLIALPALLVSVFAYRAAMQHQVARNALRSTEMVAAGVGLFCCVATSDTDEDCCVDNTPVDEVGEPPEQTIEADVVLYNATAQDVVLRVRPLKLSVDLDCNALDSDPGRLLTSPLFDTARSWTLPADTNLAVDTARSGTHCYAAWVEGDLIAPRILFWFDYEAPFIVRPLRGTTGESGVVTIAASLDGALELGGSVTHVPIASDPEDHACQATDDGRRFGWSAPAPAGSLVLERAEFGLDGCWELQTRPAGVESGSSDVWYVCVPETSFPFVVGDELLVTESFHTGAALLLTAHDPAAEFAYRNLAIARDSVGIGVGDLQWTFEPDPGCAPSPVADCGTVNQAGRAHAVSTIYGEFELAATQELTWRDGNDGSRIGVAASSLQSRLAIDPECAAGHDAVGPEFEIAITHFHQ